MFRVGQIALRTAARSTPRSFAPIASPALHLASPSEQRKQAVQPSPLSFGGQRRGYATEINPEVVQKVTDALSGVAHIGELRELGLGSYATPVGILQNLVESASAFTGLPWFGGIVLTTLALRLATLPIVIKSMRNNVILQNLKPEIELHTTRLKQCQSTGDREGAALATQNLQNLFANNNCHPLKSLVPMFFQAPIFISMFMALRKMAELPVESLKTGGALWFPDLTAGDPYYIMPVLASATMLLTIEFGTEGAQQQQKSMKVFFRILSVATLPITLSFPTAVFTYWLTSNVFSLSQVLILKTPGLKKSFGIPDLIQHPASETNTRGFLEEMKASYDSTKQAQLLEQQEKSNLKKMEALSKVKVPKKEEPIDVKPVQLSKDQLKNIRK